ncbi:MAG: eukaryotic-like serine/threonine-protein kinase, partial [Actinomycetota bacterium]|nr:eukaryotic-like serine/threonine-protein kinase [Actinomycetota bacterium]
LSPEQAQGQPLDHRSDLYSLGMVLYEMLAGRAPFTGDSPIAVAYKHVNEVPPPPSVYNPDVPPSLDGVVMRALAKDPDHRQQSAEALRAELLDVQFGASEPEPTAIAAVPGAVGGAAAATAVAAAPIADMAATSIAPGGSTSIMPPPTGVDIGPPPVAAPRPRPVGPPPRDPGVYRRRQLTVAVVALLAAVALIALVSSLSGGDDGGAAVTVPDVVGFNVNDAVHDISEAGLDPEIKVDDTLDGAVDEVAKQEPLGGTSAKQGDKVTLFLPSGSTDTSVQTVPSTAPPTTAAPATTSPPATSPPTTQSQATTPPTLPPTTTPAPTTTSPPPTTVPTTSEVSVPTT